MEQKYSLFFLLFLIAGIGFFARVKASPSLLSATDILFTLQDIQPTDTIRDIEFSTRVDSIYKYLTKEPNSQWEIVFKDGIRKPDLQTGDMLKVTSEDGMVKYYFLELDPYIPSSNALLGSITWPDMPNAFKGEIAHSYGWHGDTIPSFDSLTMNYVLILPIGYQKIPALTFSTCDLNANVKVNRVVSLEGSAAERTITFTVTAEDSITKNVYSVLLKKEQDTLDISQKSTVTSRFYKVSEGSSLKETIKGVPNGTTVNDFFPMITKASELQTLKVISSLSGNELDEGDFIAVGDMLEVLSEDKIHTTKYIIEATAEVPSTYTLLTSSVYAISVRGVTGTISGFPINTSLKTILSNVSIPSGATLTVVDRHDAYQPLVRLNYDTVYVDVQVSADIYFEVIAEVGVGKVLYQLLPDSRSGDAYVTSDLYNVDQKGIAIYPFRQGTSVSSLLRDVIPARGATMKIFDKGGFVRTTGHLYKDDKLVVISEDKSNTKVYYLKTMNYVTGPYLPYIFSDIYAIDQVKHLIFGAAIGSSRFDFISKLIPSVGSTVKVMDAGGHESTSPTINKSDYVLVTIESGNRYSIYKIDHVCCDGVNTNEESFSFNLFPNPTSGNVNIHGLAPATRIRIITPSGMVLQDKIADRQSLTISLEGQPAGIYLFVVSRDHKPPSIQKIVKK